MSGKTKMWKGIAGDAASCDLISSLLFQLAILSLVLGCSAHLAASATASPVVPRAADGSCANNGVRIAGKECLCLPFYSGSRCETPDAILADVKSVAKGTLNPAKVDAEKLCDVGTVAAAVGTMAALLAALNTTDPNFRDGWRACLMVLGA
jgi:hypothetical protein